MATRGPVPKRDSSRVRFTAPGDRADQVTMEGPVDVPAAGEGWHKNALAWYESLAKSGQAHYYEPSDWSKAWLIADNISRAYFAAESGEDVTAATFKVLFGEMASLGVTESDRRRMRIEIQRNISLGEDEADNVIRGQFEALDNGA